MAWPDRILQLPVRLFKRHNFDKVIIDNKNSFFLELALPLLNFVIINLITANRKHRC